jgi:hypothetical protein
MLSMNERWLLATISGPVDGISSRPSIRGRQNSQNTVSTTRRETR